jgi:hypothetical protein
MSNFIHTEPSGGAADSACQHLDKRLFSRLSQPYPIVFALGFVRNLMHLPFPQFVQKYRVRVLGLRGATPRVEDEVLSLRPGEWVQVRPEAEIRATLDESGRLKGLMFLPGMSRDCDRTFRVYKRLEKLFWEESRQQRRMKNTVLLEGSICEGEGLGCDRSCLYFWRERWLRRVDPPPPGMQSHAEAVGEGRES